jgi:thioester reductase-like protein
VEGDLTLESMGLSEESKILLTEKCTNILHIGASTDFGAPLDESRRINVEGTRKVLDFALNIKPNGSEKFRFDYVSTAFVAGTLRGSVDEFTLNRGQEFANAYEQSKFEAECLVQTYRNKLSMVVHRPSIVVGDSRNGFTPHFKVLYWPLQLLAKDLLPFIPCNTRAQLDIVPVDFVAKAMYRILMSPKGIGQTFHLTAGAKATVPIRKFLRDAFRYTDIKWRPTMPLWVFKLVQRTFLRNIMSEDFWRACELASVYSKYLSGTSVRFDNTKTVQFLKVLSVGESPHWNNYARQVLGYCMQTRWGKRLILKEYQYRNPLEVEV